MKTRCKGKYVLLASLLCMLNVDVLLAQGLQNAIVGQVRDQTKAVVPNATIKVTNIATNISRTVITDQAGNYTVTSLVVGEYLVQAELPGFKTAVQKGVIVQANNSVRVDLILVVGERNETVEVTAEPILPMLRTEDPATGLVIGRRQVENLPLKGRDFVGLAAMVVPGANEAVGGNQNDLGRTQALNLSVNGQRMFDNNYRLDGVSFISSFVNGSTFVPSIEAIEEVSVQTGQYSAALGLYSGAQVDMVVKSGSNKPHGGIYEFLRNDALNARQFFDKGEPPPFRYNQFGANLGGPVILPKIYSGRDRTFFFFAFEGIRSLKESTLLGTVASDRMRGGDFSALLPTKIIRDPYTKQPFVGNIIPTGKIAPQAIKLMEYIPHENIPGAASNFVNVARTDEKERQFFARIDHKLSTKDSVFFRFALRTGNSSADSVNPYFKSFYSPQNQNFVLSETHIFRPNVINEFKVSYVRESTPKKSGREFTDIDALRDFGMHGLSSDNPFFRGVPAASISGYLGTGELSPSLRLLYSSPMVQDQLMYQIRQHTIRFGGEYFKRRQDFFSVGSYQGSYTFSGILTGNAFADFILGLPQSTRISKVAPETGPVQQRAGAFVQDDWRIMSRLTVNLGIRYEYAGSFQDRLGNARNFDWSTLSLFPDPGTVAPLNDASHDFAPRVGFALRLKGETVLRGGYGIFYTQPTVANVNLLRAPPVYLDSTYNTNLTSPDLSLDDGFLATKLNPPPKAPDLQTIPMDYGPGYAQTYSFSIQQGLGAGWVAEIGYVGSHTIGLDNAHTENTPPPGPGVIQDRRPIQQYGNIRVFGTDAMSSYNALQARLQTRNWHGLNLITSYTYSKCLDTHSNAATSTAGDDDQEPQNQNDRVSGEKGRCILDFRQQYKAHVLYTIPFPQNTQAIAKHLLSGWQLAGGPTLRTGAAISVITSANTANTSRGTIRPNRVSDGNLEASKRSVDLWFDTNAFVAPALYTFGNSGRNIIEIAGRKLIDFSLSREFRLFESHAIQFRAEMFNAFNTPQFNAPGRTLGTTAFGTVTSTGPAREMQFGLKYYF